jgi:TonB-linked SusC/RagA family outer membrane protein
MLVAGAVPVWAQAVGVVQGNVLNAGTQRPLEGVRIILVGTTRTATTDVDGRYTMREVSVGAHSLRAAIIGFASQVTQITVAAGQTLSVDFTLNAAAISLDEIVVTGTAGTTEKRAIGNAVSTIQVGGVVETAPIKSVEELLNARAPGLTLIRNSGQAGTSTNVRIRGAGSLEGGYEPVYYIDGIRFESQQTQFSTNGTVHSGSALDFINPQDIESIEVIKGPAAATLYGADAAGGVIQIITKKGRRGDQGVQWTIGMEVGESEWTEQVGNPVNYWRCTAAQQANATTHPGCAAPETVEWWGKDANGNPVLNTGIPQEDMIDVGDGTFLLVDDPIRRHPVAIRKGSTTDFNLSARGGGESFGYFLSFNRNDEDGIFLNNYSRRTAGRANFDVTASEALNLSAQFSYGRTGTQQPLNNNASNSVLRNAFRGRARATPGPWEAGFLGFNPWLSNEYNQHLNAERMTIGLNANWAPLSFFQSKLTLGMDRQSFRQTTFYAIDTTGSTPWGSINGTGVVDHTLPITHTWTVDYSGTLDFDLSEAINTKFSAGMQLNARQRRETQSRGEGLVANNLNLVGSAAVTTGDEEFEEQTSLGFYVQDQLAWRDRVFVTGAVRIDDNSAFGSDFSLVVYPKAHLSWLISDESFYNLGFMDQLKLRFAWGRAGNAPDPFTADRTYTVDNTVLGDQVVNTLRPSSFGNPNLKAETGQEWEAGFDASLLNGRAGLEFTYYNQLTKDALVSVPDAGSTGFIGNHLTNIGEIKNTGIEILLSANPILSRNFSWDASVSFATNGNELVSFNGAREEVIFGAFADVQRHREGYSLGGFWAYDVERDGAGNPVIYDGAGNVITDPTVVGATVNVLNSCRWAPSDPSWNQADECDDIFLGPSTPTREVALTNTFTLFGNLRLFTQLDYRGGHYQWCAICSLRSRIDQNSWDINTGGTDLNPDVSAADVLALRSLQTMSHITKADFLKFRELSLTYTLPASWTRFMAASRWSATLAARNIWMWTKYEGTGDPEVQFNSLDDFTRLDYAATPQTRRISAALRVTF